MNKREIVEKAISDGEALPAGPMVMTKINELTLDPNATARDLGKVLQLDPALVTRVLKQVNSSFYGLSATIKTVTHAVVILGFQEVKHIALTVPVANLFQNSLDNMGIDVEELWNRTVEEACIARTLSYEINHPVPEQVFVSGMLANSGIVIMNNILGAEYAEVYYSCPDMEFLSEVESAEIGISSTEVGARLAKKWKFPQDLVRTISCQYDPIFEEEVIPEAALVFVARRIRAHIDELGPDDPLNFEDVFTNIDPQITTELKLTSSSFEKAYEKARTEFEDAKNMLGT